MDKLHKMYIDSELINELRDCCSKFSDFLPLQLHESIDSSKQLDFIKNLMKFEKLIISLDFFHYHFPHGNYKIRRGFAGVLEPMNYTGKIDLIKYLEKTLYIIKNFPGETIENFEEIIDEIILSLKKFKEYQVGMHL